MISSRHLAYRYPSGPGIRFDDVDVPQGGLLLLSGASGSGKSTWLALAAGLLAATEGDMTVAGQPLKALGKVAGDAWRAKTIGFLPQKLHLSAALTVLGNLAMAQWAAGQPRHEGRVMEALTSLGVEALADRKPLQLSGGQAQRVALARAVLLKPQVILADEPTASLDDAAAEASLALLRSTAQRLDATLVVATHDARVNTFFKDKKGLQRMQILRKQL
jgi:putative ABC transport system ATP-binding protein